MRARSVSYLISRILKIAFEGAPAMTKSRDHHGAKPGSSSQQTVRAPQQSASEFFADDVIGRSLKAHFDDIAQAPIPDKFLALLAELEAKEQGHGR
jgi:Anti-sigma factor NepR